jgi:hypothetical protein
MQKRTQRDDKEAANRCKHESWRAWVPEDGEKRNTEVAETGAPLEARGKQRAQRRVVGSGKWAVGRDSWGGDGGAGRRGRSFEISAGTEATMGKGSAGVYWK